MIKTNENKTHNACAVEESLNFKIIKSRLKKTLINVRQIK